MAFPTSPTNGQTTTVNGVLYTYSSSTTAWNVTTAFTGNILTTTLSASGTVTGASVVGGVITGTSASVTGTVTGASVVGGVITGTSLSASGNVTGNFFLGNGSQLTGVASGTASNIASGTSNVTIVSSGGNVSVGVGGIANLAVFDTAGNTTITGNLRMTGNILPTANNVYALGAPAMTWKEVYIGPGSLYINGQQVLSSSADTIVVSANSNQNLALQTSGSGGIRLDPTGDGIIQVQGPLQIAAGNNITSSDGNAIQFASSIGVDNITSRTANNNLTLTANGTGTVTVTSPFSASGNILSAGLVSVAGNVTGGNLNTAGLVSVTGNVTSGNLNTAGLLSVTGTATIGGNVNLSGSIIPSANITYDLGSPTNRFRTLYISGNTIDMGGAKITTDATSGGFALVPPPTTDNPNPVGTVFSPTGAISTINTTAGIIAAGAINTSINNNQGTANFGNIVVRSGLPSIGANLGALQVIGGTGISGNLNVGALISAAGNIIGGNLLTGGLISATGNVIGGNLSGTSIAGTLTTAAQTNITSVGTLGSVTVTANITSGNASLGNLATANFFTGNGSQLSALTFGNISTFNTAGLTTDELYLQSTTRLNVTASGMSGYVFDQYGATVNPTIYVISGQTLAFNLNVSGHPFLIQTGASANYSVGLEHVDTAGTVSTTSSAQGKISGTLYWKIPYGITGNYKYQCSAHGGMNGNIIVTDANVSNVTVGLATFATTANSVAGANVSGAVANATYATSAGTATTAATVTTASQPNITSVGILSSVSVTGNVNANQFVGNGAPLTTITGANVSGTVANATYATSAGTATSATTSGTVTTAAQANITSVGTLTSLSSTGNITTGGYFIGTFLGNISGNLTVPGSNTQILYNNLGNAAASSGLTFDAASNALVSTGTISATGNIIGGNILGGANVNATTHTGTTVSVTGNTTSGNLLTSGLISATGNITGNYFVGNGSALTGINTTAAKISNGTSEANIGASGGNANISINGTSNVVVVSSSGITTTGLTVSNATGVVNFITTANVSLGAVANLKISGGTNGYVLQTDGAGNLAWVVQSGGGGLAYISNGTSSVTVVSSGGNVTTSVGGTSNVVVATTTGISVTGNVSAGNGYFTGNVFSSYSDVRLKTILGTIEHPTVKVGQIETFYYEPNELAVSLGVSPGYRQVGVSAQSVQRVVPEAVAPSPIDQNYLTVQYERLVPLLIEAVKELTTEVEQLKKHLGNK